jgi:YfiH family protein
MTTSPLLSTVPGLLHGFGSCAEPVPAQFAGEWQARKARWKQVHRTDIGQITSAAQECGEIDAQFSFEQGLPVAAMHADCVPILLARWDGSAVAAVHAGWRGTRAHILRVLWDQLSSLGQHPRDWIAAVGPAIGPCCYEVSEELAQDFSAEFGQLASGIAVPRTRHLDLPAINAAELRDLGIGEVELIRACTRCARDARGEYIYHSYRREGSASRQYSVVQIDK